MRLIGKFGRRITFIYFAVFSAVFLFTALYFYSTLSPGAFREIRIPFLLSFLSGILIFFVLGAVLKQSLTRQIRKATEAAVRFQKGDFSEKIPIENDDELGLMAHAMNQMARSLKNRIGEIESETTKLASLLNHMTEGVLGVSENNEVLIMNPSAEAILDIPPGFGIGRSLIEVAKSPQMDEMMRKAVEIGGLVSAEIEITFPAKKFLKVNAMGIAHAESGLCGMMVFHDHTEVRALENTRREFVANVSHELKTPLTSLQGFIETLLGGALKDKEQSEKFLRIMADDSGRLARLIDDLLELSSIESKAVRFEIEPLSVREEVQKALDALSAHFEKNQISAENLVPAGEKISADRDKFQQVLLNLFDNAVKFKKPSGGQIRITSEHINEGVQILIKDFGIGIPEKDLPRIFERFYRVDKARNRDTGGTGLGLSIVKHLVEGQGGRIACQSRPGEGAAFILTLPAVS